MPKRAVFSIGLRLCFEPVSLPQTRTMSKVVLVTGGSSGIGRAIAAFLASRDYIVYGTSRSEQSEETDGRFKLIQMDVTDADSVHRALELITEAHGRLDVLINNAGLGMAGPIESTSDQEARTIFDTNVFGVLNTCRAAVPLLRQSQGKIINITSIGGVFGLPYRGIYCASKFAVEGISEVLSIELNPLGVKVAIVQPGDFKTNINANRLNAAHIDKTVYPEFDAVLEQIHSEVKHAQDPELIGRTIERIIRSSNPKLRYRVATPTQRLSVFLNRMLSGRMFERIITRHYGIRPKGRNQ